MGKKTGLDHNSRFGVPEQAAFFQTVECPGGGGVFFGVAQDDEVCAAAC